MTENVITYLFIIAILLYLAWQGYRYWARHHYAKYVENQVFQDKLHQGQLVDLRDPVAFRKKHILGARNFNIQQFKESLGALVKTKPVLLYGSSRDVNTIGKAIRILHAAGYKEIYVLKFGIDYWEGKVKEG